VWHRITRREAITGMAGLRRRCAPRNDGGVGARISVMTGVAQDLRNDGCGTGSP